MGMTPRKISNRHSVEELIAQFVLSRERPSVDWPSDSIGGWHLAVEKRLPCFRVRRGDNAEGWLLGHAIGPDGRLVHGEMHLPADEPEQAIYSHGGRFLVILPVLGRIYLDPCGLLSAVYCKHARTVASTAGLIPYDDATADRTELIESIGIPFKSAMYPGDLTPRRAIDRILPNHYLDLNTWQTVRHWPVEELPPVEDASAAVAEIADITRQQIRAVLEDGPATLRLTAGRDSRMLLACARGLLEKLECVTLNHGDDGAKIDYQAARKLAGIAGVPHRVIDRMEPDENDLELWAYRSGLGTGEYRGWRAITTYRHHLDPLRTDLVGSVGELARAFYWQPDDTPTMDVPAERLLGHCNCPATPETLTRARRWMDGAVAHDSLQLLDLYYLEQRLGGWAGVWSYTQVAHCRYQAFPLSHRRTVELMMRLPIENRRGGLLAAEVIAREWPELLKIPFNTPAPFHRVVLGGKSTLRFSKKLGRAIRDPRRAFSRLLGR